MGYPGDNLFISAGTLPELLPPRPYCSDRLEEGLQIRPLLTALQRRYVQYNGPAAIGFMLHDIDRPDAYFAHRDAILPPPNAIALNPENGHALAVAVLEVPVARHSMSRIAPLKKYAAIERGFSRRLGADPAYSALIGKNLLHSDWRVEWRRDKPYSLDELEDWLFENDMRPETKVERTVGAGRNVTVFDDLREIAYREIRTYKRDGANFEAWHTRCLSVAQGSNMQFARALGASEVKAIAKSVAKWTWRNMSPEKYADFVENQRKRSSLGNQIRTAARWGRHVAESKTQPWKNIGISRATYYRRKKANQLATS